MFRACLPAGLAICVLLGSVSAAAQGGPPIDAKPGECYARVITPPQYRSVTENVLAKAQSERVEVVPARYEQADETVEIKPAYERVVEVTPAQYRWEEEQVVVKPASERIEQIPATYRSVTEQQVVRPATTVWKRGHGLTEKVDNQTGVVMCLVEVPAEYRSVTRSEVDRPADTRHIAIPAQTQTVRRQVLVKEAEVRKEQVPAQVKTIKVNKLVAEEHAFRVTVPAEYQTVTRQEKVADGRMEWRSVLCDTNATPGTVKQLQKALRAAGYPTGASDGRLGSGTLEAVRKYQSDHGLPQGGVTLEVLERLGVPSKLSPAPRS